MSDNNLFELNPKQRKEFLKFKTAYKNLIKLGCGVYNNYGMMGFFDGKKIKEYDDIDSEDSILDSGQNSSNEISTVDSWADDSHYFHKK